MIEDKARWNEKHQTALMPTAPIAALVKAVQTLNPASQTLDLACGTGRHTHYLAGLGHCVDAVDLSDVALSKLDKHPCITPIEADLDHFEIASRRYDLIVCTNYLSRRLFVPIHEGLKSEGIVVFETFVQYETVGGHQTTNPEYLLAPNELLRAFSALEVLFYEERIEKNLRNEWVKVATLIAQKRA